jgi:hypothetical protein
MSNIITTNRKRTATAPTYTTKKTTAKKSKSNNTKSPAALQKTRIRKRTEYTGFLALITISAESSVNVEKIEKRVASDIKYNFFSNRFKESKN